MSPEELDEAKWDEAYTRAMEADREGDPVQWTYAATEIYRQLTIENWTPPPKVSPRVLAAREWLKAHTPASNAMIDAGGADEEQGARAFLAGFAAAVKLAEPVVEAASATLSTFAEGHAPPALHFSLQTYRQSIGDTPHEGQ